MLRLGLFRGTSATSAHLFSAFRASLVVCLVAVLLAGASPAFAQTATLRGQIFDQTGAVVARATVVLTDSQDQAKTAVTSNDGSYLFTGLAPGKYKVQASAPDMSQEPVSIDLKPGVQTLKLELKVTAAQQELTVRDNPGVGLSTDSSANANSLVLSGKDLNALADNPEDMASDLQALAGPSAGPDGSSVYIDGFTGGTLPPKDAIREIRINQNPFSPEYDKLGYGRVEILTKPGANKLHGGGYFNFGDDVWNSRNPYAAEKAPFLLREYGASLEGPLRRSASFFLALDGAAIDNGAIINGSILDPATLTIIDPYTEVFTIPQERIRPSVRVDYQLTPADTISLRYQFADADIRHAGVGGFNLTSMGVHNHGTDQTVQFSNTLTLGASAANETRLQYYRAQISNVAEIPDPQLQVLNAFTGGGAQVGNSSNLLNSWELQNYITASRGKHIIRLGVRVRAQTIDNTSPINFGGTFAFAGRTAPELGTDNQPILDSNGQPILISISSIEAYRRTLLFQDEGDSPSQVRALGGGASQFTMNAGHPTLGLDQEDVGLFAGDTWRTRQNLTLDYGVRYEWQTNLHDWRDVAPRLGVAWAPGSKLRGSSPRTVVRAGFGVFYQRLDIVNVLTAERYNGVDQQSFVVTNPDFFPPIPPASGLAGQSQQAIEQLSPKLRAPYLMESAVEVERQLPVHITAALSYVNSHGLHQFLTNDINAPLPGTWNPQVPGSGTYPLGTPNPVFLAESSGLYNQNELIANVNAKISNSISLFGSYTFNHAMSNTDYASPPQNEDFNPAIAVQGLGIGSFPANPYNLFGEYGPAATDIHHQVNAGGTIQTFGGLRLNPIFVADSGAPFNITVGQDIYGTTLFNGRPGIATDPGKPGLVRTSYGLLDPNPIAGEPILRRNAGRGPGIYMLNLRLSEVFAFGPAAEGSVSAGGRRSGTGPFGGGQSQTIVKTGRRYSLAISAAIRNLLNHNNPGPIIGNITSPLFGRANQPYGVGSVGGTGFSESADNRRLEFQTRLTF